VGAARARRAVWLIAAGRIALGLAVLLAPERVTARWLGQDNAKNAAVGDLARGLAARDIALGVSVLATLDDAKAGPIVQVGCALADAGDVLGTIAAREHLPRAGALGTVAIAGGAVAVGLYLAHQISHAGD